MQRCGLIAKASSSVKAYVLAEREGDWALHLHAVSKMLQYFFVLVNHNILDMGHITLMI